MLAAALLALALSAPPAQSAERSTTTPVTGGQTLLRFDGGTAAVLTTLNTDLFSGGLLIGQATVIATTKG
jgi:hypothetical protein